MIYISLLRGINVGGQKPLKMGELTELCLSLGFKKAVTYLQSGNVIFEYEKFEPSQIADRLEKAIAGKFGFEVPVLTFTIDKLRAIITANPLTKQPGIDLEKLHVTLLKNSSEINAAEIEPFREENERFVIHESAVYLYCPNGYGRTKLNNQTFERKFKTLATTRNWRTVNALLEMALKLQQ